MKEYKVISQSQETIGLGRWKNEFNPEELERNLNSCASQGWTLKSAVTARFRESDIWQCLLIMEKDAD